MGEYVRSPASPELIAIIGMSCRFPGDATSPSKLWDLCAGGREGWSTIPEDRFDVKSLYHEDHERVGRVSRSEECICVFHSNSALI